jgi:DNA-binding transcriptional regulator YiaG
MAKRRTRTLGEKLIRGFREIEDTLGSGQRFEDRFIVHRVRRLSAPLPPPEYSAAEVQRLRRRLKLTRGELAEIVAVSVRTIDAWEQGREIPAMGRRILEMIEGDAAPVGDAARRPRRRSA